MRQASKCQSKGDKLTLSAGEWLTDFYLVAKIIAAITATLLAIYLAPLPDLGKGFALGVLVSTIIRFFFHFYSNERTQGKCHEDEVPNSLDATSKSSSENRTDVNAVDDKLELLVSYSYMDSDSESNTEFDDTRSLIQEGQIRVSKNEDQF